MTNKCGKIVKLICCNRNIRYIVGQGTVNTVKRIELVGATYAKPFHALVYYADFTSEVFDIDECVYDNTDVERKE